MLKIIGMFMFGIGMVLVGLSCASSVNGFWREYRWRNAPQLRYSPLRMRRYRAFRTLTTAVPLLFTFTAPVAIWGVMSGRPAVSVFSMFFAGLLMSANIVVGERFRKYAKRRWM